MEFTLTEQARYRGLQRLEQLSDAWQHFQMTLDNRGIPEEFAFLQLGELPFFHFTLSREEANALLAGHPTGTYLVRIASDKRSLVLAVVGRAGTVFQHRLIVTDARRVKVHGHHDEYSYLQDLLADYATHPDEPTIFPLQRTEP